MTVNILVSYTVLLIAFQFDFPSFMVTKNNKNKHDKTFFYSKVLVITLFNNTTLMTVSKDRVKPSPHPIQWLLSDVFAHASVYGIYSAICTVTFFVVIVKTSFFQDRFGVDRIEKLPDDSSPPGWNLPILSSIIYLQSSIMAHALIFITRSRKFFFLDRPSLMLIVPFAFAQICATLIAVYANWGFTNIAGCGWKWAGIVWVWNLVWFFPFDLLKVGHFQLMKLLEYFLFLVEFSSF